MKIKTYSELANTIKEQASLYDFIKNDCDLVKENNYYIGKCPIIVDCSGKFTVNPKKNIYYCFGCHKSGDIITYTAIKLTQSPLVAALFLAKNCLNLDNIDEESLIGTLSIKEDQ